MKKYYTILFALVAFATILSQPSFAQWSTAVNLSPNGDTTSMNESMGSCLGVSGDTLQVVWTTKINAHHASLHYSRSLDTGLTWSNPIVITPATGNAWNPAIAVNGRNVHVAWREIDTVSGHRASWYKHSLDGGNTWSASVFLDSTADWPAISVSGNKVFIANDRIVSQSPYNTEIFFLYSLDNGTTWSNAQQLTNAVGRSEDESITADGSNIHMSWNDNRTGQFQIFYKHSSDYGITWGPDVVVDTQFDYNTMVCSDGAYVDVISCGAPSGRYQLLLAQSLDTGATWSTTNMNLSNDTAHTYFLPHMTRDGCDLHVVTSSGGGSKYYHSGDGGTTWDAPYILSGANFIAYTQHALHVLYVNANHNISYLRNPTGNSGLPCIATEIQMISKPIQEVSVFPNPATNIVTIHQDTYSSNQQIIITDVLGNRVYSQALNTATETIDISHLSRGVYFYEINGKRGKIIKE